MIHFIIIFVIIAFLNTGSYIFATFTSSAVDLPGNLKCSVVVIQLSNFCQHGAEAEGGFHIQILKAQYTKREVEPADLCLYFP